MSKMCRFFDDAKDLKLIVHESIPAVTRDRDLSGWIRGNEVVDPKKTLEEVMRLQSENVRLVKRVSELERRSASDMYGEYSFDEVWSMLEGEQISLKNYPRDHKRKHISLLEGFVAFAEDLAVGISNMMGMSSIDQFVFYEIAPMLAIYGLVEKKSVNKAGIQRFQTSPAGNRFLAKAIPMLRKEPFQEKKRKTSTSKRSQRTTKVDAAKSKV